VDQGIGTGNIGPSGVSHTGWFGPKNVPLLSSCCRGLILTYLEGHAQNLGAFPFGRPSTNPSPGGNYGEHLQDYKDLAMRATKHRINGPPLGRWHGLRGNT
jgi:hypothetical protein